MPSGYTFKARVGAVRTISSSAQLYGTWQLGRRAHFVAGLAKTLALPIIASGAAGDNTVPTYVAVAISGFAPPTASAVSMFGSTSGGINEVIIAAPNNSYGASGSVTNTPPLHVVATTNVVVNSSVVTMLPESSNIYWANAGGTNDRLVAVGWEDNI
jgi:hypothetical protein